MPQIFLQHLPLPARLGLGPPPSQSLSAAAVRESRFFLLSLSLSKSSRADAITPGQCHLKRSISKDFTEIIYKFYGVMFALETF